MKRLAVAALAAAIGGGIAAAAVGQSGGLGRPLVLHGTRSASPLLGISWGRRQDWLVRLDPKTLRARPGRRLGLAEFSGTGWSYSRDRSVLALGNFSSSMLTVLPARVRLVDTQRLRRLRDLDLGITGDVAYTHWVAPDRLLALVRSRDDPGTEGEPAILTERVVVVDPSTGAVLAREMLQGHVAALATADQALLLVLEGKTYGPVRLAVFASDGSLKSVALDQVRAGRHETPTGVPRDDGVAVAVDRERGRAYVVAAGEPVAEVALGTLTVEYHVPSEPVSLLGRLHDWFEPQARAKGPLEGSWRSALWLGDGRLAVYGRDMSTYTAGDELAVRERPSGLLVIDTRSWTAHMIDPKSSALLVATGALLSWGWGWDGGTQRMTGAGLSAYDESGARRFHLFGREVVYDVQTVGRRAFVGRRVLDHRYSVVDLSTGRRLQAVRGNLPLVLTPAGSPFYP